MPARTQPKVENIVFSPPEVAERTVTLIKRLHDPNAGGMTTGIPDLDKTMTPMRPGQLWTVLGYASNYKSGLMNFIIQTNLPKMAENEVIVKFTWEQSIEEDTLSWLSYDSQISVTQMSRGQLDKNGWELLMKSYGKRTCTPLWIAGHSTSNFSAGQRTVRPRMTIDDVVRGCELICHGATDQDLKIRLIVLDYLQRIPPRQQDGNDRRLQMAAAVDGAKDLALYFDCVTLLGCQSGRQVLDRDFKLPRTDDAQETSNVEQSSDGMLSTWYPIKTEKPGKKIKVTADNGDTQEYTVTPNLLVVGLIKQKLGPAPSNHYLYVDPAHNKIAGMTPEPAQPQKETKVYRG